MKLGRYRILAKLGQGGLATVWKATDELLGRPVALKVLNEHLGSSPKARRRFLHDAQATAALDHPGIIAIYDTGEDGGLAYIAFALIDGQTVSELASTRLLPFGEAVRIAHDAAEALGHAHERGVVHRDVTGRNIMVARDGRVVVLDFGLALVAWESRVTTTEGAMGTAHYMAPEVIQARPADARSDLYGLGVVLYEALTGTFPFSAEEPHALFYSAMNLAPTRPRERRPGMPAALERVVLRAIARDPDERYQTAAEFIAALEALDLSAEVVTPQGSGQESADEDWTSIHATAKHARADEQAPTYLAVLPFEGLASDGDSEGVCATLASRLGDTLSAALAAVPGVRVVPPVDTTPAGDLRGVATRLGAGVLLRGRVRRDRSRLRVEYSLLDPFRGVELGGDVVDGSAFQLFDLEDQVVVSVTRALGLESQMPGPRSARPPDPTAHDRYLQALGYLKRHDNEASVEGAIVLLERLVASVPALAIHHAALARAYLHKERRTKQRVWESRAAAACARALALDPDAPEVRIAVGEVRLKSGQSQEALEAFSEALCQRPDDFDAALGTAKAHAAAGRLTDARRACEHAIVLQATDWRGYDLLARIHFQSGKFDQAAELWSRVVHLTPDNSLGRRHLGSAFYRLDRLEEAAAAYRESVAIQPNDEAYGNLGAVQFSLGRRDEAIAALRKATELTPTNPHRWGNLGLACQWVAGYEKEAETALDRAIGLMRERLERDPTQAEWWAFLAEWLVGRGRRDEAEAAIRRALELGPENVECMHRAGHVYHDLGDRERCLHWFREARRSGLGAGELRRSLSLAALRNDPEFIRILEEVPTTPGRLAE